MSCFATIQTPYSPHSLAVMEKPGFLIQHFMIAGLLAAIGIVVLAGQSHAGNRYCAYYPEDPNCYEALYGQGGVSQAPSR